MSGSVRSRPSPAVLVAIIVVLAATAIVVLNLPTGDRGARSASPSTAPSSTFGAIEPTPSAATTSPGASASPTALTTDTPEGVARWSAVTTQPGPSPRSGHTWTVDPSSATAYIFGGRGASAALQDLWAYDLNADRWQELQPTGARPPARSDHGAAWIDGLGLVVVGGTSDSGDLDDVWAFDPGSGTSAWRKLSAKGDVPQGGAACLSQRGDGRMWLLGGAATDSTEAWIYDPGRSAWSRRTMTGGPGARTGAACWWTADDRLAVYGGERPGSTSAALGDMWILDPEGQAGTWTEMTDLTPRQRAGRTTTSHGAVVVGGVGEDDALLGDVVVFDPRTVASTGLRTAPEGPPPRSGPALADDPEGERTLMFGGLGAEGPLADVWALDLP